MKYYEAIKQNKVCTDRNRGGDRDRDGGRDTDIDIEIEIEICKSLQNKCCFVQEPRHPTRVLGTWEASISIC